MILQQNAAVCTLHTFSSFIDSNQHLTASLDKLVKNLTHASTDQLKHVGSYIEEEYDGSEEKFDLVTRKGVYPYSYIKEARNFEEG